MELDTYPVDDDFLEYVPLQRPVADKPNAVPVNEPVVESDEPESEASSSDSETAKSTLKTKKRKLLPYRGQQPKQTKYNLWSQISQDALIEDEFQPITLSTSRGKESYDFKRFLAETVNDASRDEQNMDLTNNQSKKKTDKNSKYLPKVFIDETDTNESFSQKLVDALQEHTEQAKQTIARTVDTIGMKKTLQIYLKTKKIERDGGMQTILQDRRRTSGGVFFHLLKMSDIPNEQKESIFLEKEKKKKQREARRMTRKEAQKARRSQHTFSTTDPNSDAVEKIEEDSVEDTILPTRAALELELIDKNEMIEMPDGFVLKNPPPSPVNE